MIKITNFLKVDFLKCQVAPYGPDAPLEDFIDITYEAMIGTQEITGKYFCEKPEDKTFADIKREIIEALRNGLNERR